jgi:hypothetical protein
MEKHIGSTMLCDKLHGHKEIRLNNEHFSTPCFIYLISSEFKNKKCVNSFRKTRKHVNWGWEKSLRFRFFAKVFATYLRSKSETFEKVFAKTSRYKARTQQLSISSLRPNHPFSNDKNLRSSQPTFSFFKT